MVSPLPLVSGGLRSGFQVRAVACCMSLPLINCTIGCGENSPTVTPHLPDINRDLGLFTPPAVVPDNDTTMAGAPTEAQMDLDQVEEAPKDDTEATPKQPNLKVSTFSCNYTALAAYQSLQLSRSVVMLVGVAQLHARGEQVEEEDDEQAQEQEGEPEGSQCVGSKHQKAIQSVAEATAKAKAH